MAFDAFMKIEGVDGESSFSKHKDWIEVESWSWGEAPQSPGGAGPPISFKLSFSKKIDKSSPVLMQACCTKEIFAKAQLSCVKTGDKSSDVQSYLQYKFTDVMITNYFGKGRDDSAPNDEMSFSFSKMEFDYRMPRGDGSLGPLVHGECLAP